MERTMQDAAAQAEQTETGRTNGRALDEIDEGVEAAELPLEDIILETSDTLPFESLTGAESDAPEELAGEDAEAVDDTALEALPLAAQLSALLFVSPKPLTTAQLAETARESEELVELALQRVAASFQEDLQGFTLVEVAGAWQFRTSPRAARTIQRMIPPRAKRLSRAAAESLAIIAYRQPVPRSEIEAIRGVDALPTLRTLLDARLIRVVGRSHTAGHPVLYGTTTTFLEKFGLRDLSDLPNSRELLELAGEQGESVAADPDEERSDLAAEVELEQIAAEESAANMPAQGEPEGTDVVDELDASGSEV